MSSICRIFTASALRPIHSSIYNVFVLVCLCVGLEPLIVNYAQTVGVLLLLWLKDFKLQRTSKSYDLLKKNSNFNDKKISFYTLNCLHRCTTPTYKCPKSNWSFSRGRFHAVAFGDSDLWQVTCHMRHMTHDTWHLPYPTRFNKVQ